jgi:malonyl CoA-acyl carrier protein transacylase
MLACDMPEIIDPNRTVEWEENEARCHCDRYRWIIEFMVGDVVQEIILAS